MPDFRIEGEGFPVRVLTLAAIALGVLAAGCTTDGSRFVGRPGLEVVQQAELPAPSAADLVAQQRPYQIGPFDRVSIDVYGAPELSRTVQVDASGQISLPLIGVMEVAGKSPSEVSRMVENELRTRYMRDPAVTVNADTVNQMITVEGQVERPGLYPVTGRMTLMRAVARAEGLTDYANANHVVVFRTVNSRQMAALYDLRAIRQGAYEDPEVFANDVVMVGESRGRRLFDALIASAGILTTPLVALLN
jgi:polysaccharide export outer membrane protein